MSNIRNPVKRHRKAGNGLYFNADTMRKFKSKYHQHFPLKQNNEDVIIVSNQNSPHLFNGQRYYYFVVVDQNGDIHRPLGGFKCFPSEAQAKKMIFKLYKSQLLKKKHKTKRL